MYKRDNRGAAENAAALAVWLGPQLGLMARYEGCARCDIYWKIYRH